MFRSLTRFDHAAVVAVARVRRPWLSPLLRAVTISGSGRCWFPVAIVLSIATRLDISLLPGQLELLGGMLGAFVALLAGTSLKRLFRRRRPQAAVAGHTVLYRPESDLSFPSTHTATASALFFGLLLHGHPLMPAVGVWAGLVAFSRLYLGHHFPTDIAGGLLLGLSSGLFDYTRLVETILRLPG